MSDAITKRSDVAGALYATMVEERIIMAARTAAVMLQLVTKKQLADPGPIAHTFGKLAALTADTITEGDDPDLVAAATGTPVTITADQVGVDIGLSDKLKSTGIAGLAEADQMEQGRAIAGKIDKDLCSLFSGFSNQVGTTNTPWSLTQLNAARFILDDAAAPDGNFGDPSSLGPTPNGLRGKILVVSPSHTYRLAQIITASGAPLFSDPKTTDVLFQDGSKPAGYKGTFLGIPIFETNNCPRGGSLDVDHIGGMFVPSALAIVMKWLIRFEQQRVGRITKYYADAFYGVGELMDAYGVGIITKYGAVEPS